MIAEGEQLPAVTAPRVDEQITPVALDGLTDGVLVLAFFPGAFTSVCTHEMNSLEQRHDELTTGGQLIGVSVDLPFALRAFREQLDLSFPLLSDSAHELVRGCGLTTEFAESGVKELAQRAVVVADPDGVVTYVEAVDPGTEPDYDALVAAVEAAR